MEITHLSTFFDLCGRTWHLLVNNWGRLFRLLSLGFIGGIAIVGVSMLMFIVPMPKLLATIIIIIVSIWFVAVFSVAFIALFVKEDIAVREALSIGKENYFSFLVFGFIQGLILMIGNMLFIVPGVILSILFLVSPFVFVAESTGPFDSLVRSIHYIKPRFLDVVIRIGPLYVLSF